MKKKFIIQIKANWNDSVLATWEYPAFLVKSVEDVRKFVKEHIYKCSDFSDCVCCVREVEG